MRVTAFENLLLDGVLFDTSGWIRNLERNVFQQLLRVGALRQCGWYRGFMMK